MSVDFVYTMGNHTSHELRCQKLNLKNFGKRWVTHTGLDLSYI